jgi:hypothetical protein
MKTDLKPLGSLGIAQLRNIVEARQAASCRGQKIDAYTASMLVQVYDGLTPENRARFETLPLVAAVKIGWQCIRKTGTA